jgi:hypothetical protein
MNYSDGDDDDEDDRNYNKNNNDDDDDSSNCHLLRDTCYQPVKETNCSLSFLGSYLTKAVRCMFNIVFITVHATQSDSSCCNKLLLPWRLSIDFRSSVPPPPPCTYA